ncbi:MAG: HD domain-containing protein, partial [Alphaproteobacteria bacterium]|nr:HD domain-containing protein [Alphaproteobacteria bacterium]
DQADDRQFDCLIGSIQNLDSEAKATEREVELQTQVQRAGHEIVHVLSKALAHRDPYTYDHQNRVATLAVSIGRQLGIRGEQLQHLEMGARIHDIGKLDIPAEILSKPGELTPQEFDLVKTHSASGCDIVDSPMLPPVIRDIILHHHERWNGTGYPDGLKGTEISLEARIVAVADTLESITTHRPYRPGRGLNIALGIINEEKGVLFDSEVADMCISMGKEGYFDWLIHPHA